MKSRYGFSDFYSEDEMARFLGVTVETLRKRRCAGKNHPPFVSIGNGVVFPKDEFDRWVRSRISKARDDIDQAS